MCPAVVHDQTDLPFLDDHLVAQLLHPVEDGTIHPDPVLVHALSGKSVEVHPLKGSWPYGPMAI